MKNETTGGGGMTAAERELSAFFRAVTELYGPEQAEASAEDWLRELMARCGLPASGREWREVSIAAASRLAGRVGAGLLRV
ncbi:hypothetical protein [uncultured Paludibaculum sp.]|uniref:hypothetical protein n=1 Tax=uncultured Paludibaculum sp. TaxID=1765020 RepID=UPI002AAB19CC|nr:hypothetical protein [uncultured Paludibaculum sp.]